VCEAQVVDRPGAIELEDSPNGYDIELKDVTFGYRPDLPILQVGLYTSMWLDGVPLACLQDLLTAAVIMPQ
jgi:hypothetical protein